MMRCNLIRIIFSLIAAVISITPVRLSAQLSSDLAQIQQEFDLMGGVVTVFCADQIVHHVPFGMADLDRGIPVTDSTLFRIASISKLVTAMAFLNLVEDDLADLDADIGLALGYEVRNPNFPDLPITARMLLSHTSTIIDGPTYSAFLSATTSQSPIPGLNALLVPGGQYYSSGQFNSTVPGTYFNYSNANFVTLGTLIEAASSQRFDEYCRTAFFLPMGLTASYNVNHIANLDNLAVLYRKQGGVWTPQADDFGGVQPVFNNLSGYVPGTNGARFGPQGGLRCSGADLSKIMMLLLSGGLHEGLAYLTPESIAAMLSPEWIYSGSNGNNYFGLFNSWGLGVHRVVNTPGGDGVLSADSPIYGHPGEAYGLVSDAYIDPERLLGLVFMTNGCGAGYEVANGSAFYTIEKEVFEAIDPYADALGCEVTVNEVSSTHLRVFPNPAHDQISFEVPIRWIGKSYAVYDGIGRLVYRGRLTSAQESINVASWKKGSYRLVCDESFTSFQVGQL